MTNIKVLELLNLGKIEEAKKGLTEDIRAEIEKGKGTKKSDARIIKEICNTEKRWECFFPFQYEYVDYKGFLEGHYILGGQNDFSYPEASKEKDCFRLEGIVSAITESDFNIEIKIDMNELQFFYKTHKKDKKPFIIPYVDKKGNENRIGVNSNFLLNALLFNETDIIRIRDPKSFIIIKNDEKKTIGFVLPVNLPREDVAR